MRRWQRPSGHEYPLFDGLPDGEPVDIAVAPSVQRPEEVERQMPVDGVRYGMWHVLEKLLEAKLEERPCEVAQTMVDHGAEAQNIDRYLASYFRSHWNRLMLERTVPHLPRPFPLSGTIHTEPPFALAQGFEDAGLSMAAIWRKRLRTSEDAPYFDPHAAVERYVRVMDAMREKGTVWQAFYRCLTRRAENVGVFSSALGEGSDLIRRHMPRQSGRLSGQDHLRVAQEIQQETAERYAKICHCVRGDDELRRAWEEDKSFVARRGVFDRARHIIA